MTDVRGTVNFNRYDADLFSGAPTNPAVSTDQLKRVSDVGLAALLLAFTLPLFLVAAVWTALEAKGSIFTVHRRSGLGGAPITVFKFRTKASGAARADGSSDMTLAGRMLKGTGLDALPLLFSVLKGDMSMVGPEPHSFSADRYYMSVIPQYSGRTRAKPGFTGLAQANGLTGRGCSIQGMAERVADDNAYIDYWSSELDLKILVRAAIRTVYRPTGS